MKKYFTPSGFFNFCFQYFVFAIRRSHEKIVLTLLQSCTFFPRMIFIGNSFLLQILKVLSETAVAVRTKAMKCLTAVVEADPGILARVNFHNYCLDKFAKWGSAQFSWSSVWIGIVKYLFYLLLVTLLADLSGRVLI